MENKKVIGLIAVLCLTVGFLTGFLINNKSGLIDDLNKKIDEVEEAASEAERVEDANKEQAKVIAELEEKNSKILNELLESKAALEVSMTENATKATTIENDIAELDDAIAKENDATEKARLEAERADKLEEQLKLATELAEFEKEEIRLLNLKIEKIEILAFVLNEKIFDYTYDFEHKTLITKGLKDNVEAKDLPETLIIGQSVVANGVTYTNGTTTITTSLFQGELEGVKKVIIEEGTKTIEESAFASNSIESVELPDTLETVGKTAFYGNSLNSVVFGDGLKEIKHAAFGRNAITTLNFPESLTIIGESAFSRNELKEIVIPENVTEISYTAFANNSDLNKVTMNSGNLDGVESDSFSSSVKFYDKSGKQI